MSGDQCVEEVWEPPGYWHHHQCSRRGKRVVDGKLLCEQHAKQAERLAVINARFKR